MYESHFKKMTEAVVQALGNYPEDQPVIEAALRKYWKDRVAFTWSLADVDAEANSEGLVLTRECARGILHRFFRNHDSGREIDILRGFISGGREMTYEERDLSEAGDFITDP